MISFFRFFLAVILCGFSVEASADGFILAGWGTDGASLQSMPHGDSAEKAREVYDALAIEANPSTGLKVFESADLFAIECKKPIQGIHTLEAGCSVALKVTTQNEAMLSSDGTLTFGGEFAKIIFDLLHVESVVRPGATTRSVGNVSCSSLVLPTTVFICEITGVQGVAM